MKSHKCRWNLLLNKQLVKVYLAFWQPIKDLCCFQIKQLHFVSPGHNQIWICNFLQSDWLWAQPKHWLDRERTKLDRNVEQGNFEANSCRVLWVECTLKKSNSNTEPINRDYFMRHSVRFTNIEKLMIENAFCKHPWISDNISRD